MLDITSLNGLTESQRKARFWLKKVIRSSWSGLATPTCLLRRINRHVDQILDQDIPVTPQKINFLPDTGLARRGEVEMTPEEVLRQLEKHEESCDKRYEDIQNRLEKLDNRLWWIVGLVVLAPFLQRLL